MNEQMRQNIEKEKMEMQEILAEHKRLEDESSKHLKQRKKTYQRDLEMQVAYQKAMKSREKDEELQHYLMGKVRNLLSQQFVILL